MSQAKDYNSLLAMGFNEVLAEFIAVHANPGAISRFVKNGLTGHALQAEVIICTVDWHRNEIEPDDLPGIWLSLYQDLQNL